MLDSGDVWNSNDFSQGFVLENVNNMVAWTNEQIIRMLHPQRLSVRGMDGVRRKRTSLLQLSNFVRDHLVILNCAVSADKIDN
jgi:hypothetical protein